MCKENKPSKAEATLQPTSKRSVGMTTTLIKPPDVKSNVRWFVGMMMISIFSMAFLITPFYLMTAVLLLLFHYPTLHWSLVLFVSPLIISAVLPSTPMPGLIRRMTPVLDYFEYEEIVEYSVFEPMVKEGRRFLCVCQPHGVISITNIVYAVFASCPDYIGRVPTAVADVVMYTPIIKHVMGVFGLISASKASLKERLSHRGMDGTVLLYVGGLAELFLSSESVERLYLKNRKGFIKLALTEGVEILPIYLFGNTSVLSVFKRGCLATLSRKLQVSLTYMWGKFYLPIPRDHKLLYVSGVPLQLPKIENPTQEDIDKWHRKYCDEVTRIFHTYKERCPEYKHKQLEII